MSLVHHGSGNQISSLGLIRLLQRLKYEVGLRAKLSVLGYIYTYTHIIANINIINIKI